MRIAIIWAGASGMMVAATLAERWISGENIVLFDGNRRIGRKVAITGGGRCNVTTGLVKKQELFPRYVRGADFIGPAMTGFWPRKVREWFESRGVRLKVEADNRVFPMSDRGEEIIECFERIFRDTGVMLRLGERVQSVRKTGDCFGTLTDRGTEVFDRIVVATGGNAYGQTGSDGSGYEFARSLGHTVTPLAPSLASFLARESWCADISGIALPHARLEADGKQVDGPMIFTHFGISWPAAFALSAHLAFHAIDDTHPLPLRIIPDADRSFDIWERDLVTAIESNPTKILKNLLTEYFPRRLVEIVLQILRLDGELRASHISRDTRREIVKLLAHGIPLTLVGQRPGDEFVTAGGVSLDEVNPETMESRTHPGLYFTGEILDIDAVTGGFNLQACWATGRVCGVAISGLCR